MTSLLSALRASTSSLHRRVESLPLATALASGTVTPERYGLLLGQLAHLHRTFERALWPAHQADLRGLFFPELCRLDALEHDLTFLQCGPLDLLLPTLELSRRWRAAASSAPSFLAGVVYVLEGSRLGSSVLARQLVRALPGSHEGTGLAYHLHRREQLGDDFKRLTLGLEALPLEQHPAAIVGAIASFEGLMNIYEAIEAYTPGDELAA